ncbi:MAG: menaquinone biosynthesis decarboxylase [Clostridiales bacterium]|nr:menaquinone biosynthesis decarboxylase [Clostridiales bacterium]MCF8023487.1 menaquinone biosynthesis decarboxylase [Clostridiales bacterium]
MAYQDLHEFITELEKRGLLQRVQEEVDPELEITEITDRVCKQGGPALLFENVKGHDMPVLINTFGSEERVRLALQASDLDAPGRELVDLMKPGNIPSGFVDKLKSLPKLAQLSSFTPKTVKNGPCKEVVEKENVDLNKLPVLKCWPHDAGRFITLPMVITKDPETGVRNMGMYRMQVFDHNTTGMHWHIHKDGAEHYRKLGKKRLEAAAALGGDPLSIYAATAPMPYGVDEMLLAGFLRKEPVEMVKCETVDLEVPARAEIILEGYVDVDERRLEGPFGDHTGYYSLADYYPVFHVTCITRRRNPVYPAIVVGKPPMEDTYLGKLTERLFLPLLQMMHPEILDMHFPMEGVFHNCVVVSVNKKYPGHVQKIMHSLWGTGQMMFSKLIIVVDGNVDVQDMSEVWWRVFNNIDARRDLVFADGPLDVLDHSSPAPAYGAKLGIDATAKWEGQEISREWPGDNKMSREIKNMVSEKWESYGIKGIE